MQKNVHRVMILYIVSTRGFLGVVLAQLDDKNILSKQKYVKKEVLEDGKDLCLVIV